MDDPNKDDKTLDQSNSGEAEDQTDQDVDNQAATDDSGGQATDDSNTDDNSAAADAAGDSKTRGERRHERYIDKLSKEIRASNEQDTTYTKELFTPAKPYTPLDIKPDTEYDPEDLKADRQGAVDNARSEGVQVGITQGTSQVQKELWADRFEIDSERVTTRWEALNDESDHYNPKLEATLVQKYIQFAGVTRDDKGRISIEKPNIRFKDFVEAEMQNLEDYAAQRGAEASKNVKSQAAKTGVRPSGQARPPAGGHGFDPNDPVNSVARMTRDQYFKQGGKEASDKYLADRGLAPKAA